MSSESVPAAPRREQLLLETAERLGVTASDYGDGATVMSAESFRKFFPPGCAAALLFALHKIDEVDLYPQEVTRRYSLICITQRLVERLMVRRANE